MNKVFLDASYAIALGSPRDQHHARAMRLAAQIEEERTPMLTTRPILLEVGNAFSERSRRSMGLVLIGSLSRSPNVEVAPLSDELYERGLQFFQRHRDKDWGLTDCISFVVMRERGLTDALTADRHFRQAGFRPLLG